MSTYTDQIPASFDTPDATFLAHLSDAAFKTFVKTADRAGHRASAAHDEALTILITAGRNPVTEGLVASTGKAMTLANDIYSTVLLEKIRRSGR